MYGFLATLQPLPDRARPAPDEMRVIVGVVGKDVPGGDLGGEVRSAADVVPDLEEGCLYSLAIQDLEQLFRVRVTRTVVEGQDDHAFLRTSVPKTRVRRDSQDRGVSHSQSHSQTMSPPAAIPAPVAARVVAERTGRPVTVRTELPRPRRRRRYL